MARSLNRFAAANVQAIDIMARPAQHILVVFDGSAAARQALLEAAALADEHDADISVITLVAHCVGCVASGLSRPYWNHVMQDLADADLATARAILGERDPAPRLSTVSGNGTAAIRQAVDERGCDLVLMPAHGLLRRLRGRQLRRAVGADLLLVRAA